MANMPVVGTDFTDNTVFIYDEDGNHLNDTIVTSHDKISQQIQVSIMPEALKLNDNCKLLILSSPTPCEYRGKVKKVGGSRFIAMFQGQEKESRGSTRYPVNTPALIDVIFTDNQPAHLQKPIQVALINISTSGVRFRAPYYSLEDNDKFQMHMIINNNRKKLIAQVINHVDYTNKEPNQSDYGCRFIEILK